MNMVALTFLVCLVLIGTSEGAMPRSRLEYEDSAWKDLKDSLGKMMAQDAAQVSSICAIYPDWCLG